MLTAAIRRAPSSSRPATGKQAAILARSGGLATPAATCETTNWRSQANPLYTHDDLR